MDIERLVRIEVLVQHQVGPIVLGMGVVVHRQQPQSGPLLNIIDLLISFAIVSLLFAVIYRILPEARVKIRRPGRRRGQRSQCDAGSPFSPTGHVGEIEHFIECVMNDKEPETPGEAGRYALECAWAAIKSFQTNQPVALPLEKPYPRY